MAMFLRFNNLDSNDRVSLPAAVPAMAGDWQVRFRGAARANSDVQIAGSNANFNRQIVLRTALDVVRVRGSLNTAYDVPCVINQNQYIDLLITSTVSPARLTVFKNTEPVGSSPVWVQQGQLNFTQGLDGFDTIGNVSTSFGQLDLYELQFKDAIYDLRYSTDGITSGTVLPDVNNSANNGTLVNFTGTPWVNDELFTLPATITPLDDFTSTAIAPYVDGAATISFSGVSVSVTIAGGQFTTQMPFITSGEVYPVLPINGAVTLTQGANSSTIFRPIVIPTPYDRLRVDNDPEGAYGNFQYIETTDDKYIGYHITLTESDTWYFDTTDGYSVDQDSGVNSDTAPRTDIGYLQNTSTGMTAAHNITITPSGSIIVEPVGITAVGLTMSGITMRGITAVGL